MVSPFGFHPMNERVVRIAFLPVLGALLAMFVLSALMAAATGYVYGLEIRLGTYTSLAKALAPILGASVLALIVVAQSLRKKEEEIEQALLRWLDTRGDWTPGEWDPEVERSLEEGVDLGNFGTEGIEIHEALREKNTMVRLRKYATRLFALPIAALTIIVAISLWAVPAAGAFLEYNSAMNTTFIFLTSYGTLMAVGSFVAAVLMTLKE